MITDPALADVLAAFYARCWWRPELRDYFRQHLIELARILPHVGAIGMMDVIEFAGDRFDFAPAAARHSTDRLINCLVFEALGEDESPFDLVALPIGEPQRPMTMFGSVGFLRPDVVMWPGSYSMGKTMQVHRDSLVWLKAGCQGTAIITPRVAAREMLDVPGFLQGEDWPHARELKRLAESVVNLKQIVGPDHSRQVAA